MFLTKDERNRFASYCEVEAKSDNDMAVQLEKMMGAEDLIAKRMKQRAVVYSIVAIELRGVEDMTL